jgi:hypothetical protein
MLLDFLSSAKAFSSLKEPQLAGYQACCDIMTVKAFMILMAEEADHVRHAGRTAAFSTGSFVGNLGGFPYVRSSYSSLSAHALMGMPVQWKPWGNSTFRPHSRW